MLGQGLQHAGLRWKNALRRLPRLAGLLRRPCRDARACDGESRDSRRCGWWMQARMLRGWMCTREVRFWRITSGFGSSTSYVPIAAGWISNRRGHSEHTAAIGERLRGPSWRTNSTRFWSGGFAVSLQELILKDQSIPAPTGDIALRFIDQSVHTGNVDIYLVPSGSDPCDDEAAVYECEFW